MAWLGTWAKRVVISLDHNDIDAALSDFPHLIKISATSGYNNKDITFVFDELQNNANRKKIAVTTDDGVTECYVEIEHWDHASEKAWLWVMVPDIDPGADTDLYLYYDSSHADNTTYVGDPNSASAENVWDDDFKFVSHMRDDPDTSHVRDSTSNDNDGAKRTTGEPAVTTLGKIDDAQDFDGSNDYISIPDNIVTLADDFTIEIWVNPNLNIENPRWLSLKDDTNNFQFGVFNDDKVFARIFNAVNKTTTYTVPYGEWHYYVFTKESGTQKILVDTVVRAHSSGGITAETTVSRIGAYDSATSYTADGILDEVRVSGSFRSTAWISASYESGRDDLNDFGEEETALVAPLVLPIGGIPLLILRPPPRRVPFIKELITFGLIRRPFIRVGRLVGRIRRSFQDEVVFSATAVKRIDEELSMGGFIVTDDIRNYAWEALFEALEKEKEELIK